MKTDDEKISEGICLSERGVEHCSRCVDVCEAAHFKFEIMSVTQKPDPECPVCTVPLDVHGTSCGWQNAAKKCNSDGIIIDERHPDFGKDLGNRAN